jgi:hypothetical protein
MEISFVNLFHFAEEFVGCMYFSKIRDGFAVLHGVPSDPIEAKSIWQITTYEEMKRHTDGNPAWTLVTPLDRNDRRPK